MATPPTAEAVTAYLRSRGHQADVASVQRIRGGGSRQIWLVVLSGATGGLPREVLIRKDSDIGGTVPTPLEREYRILEVLHRQGVRVPEPFWFEADPRWFGACFYVRRGLLGTSDQSRFSGPTAERLSADLARTLAELHAVDPEVLQLDGLARPRNVSDAANHEVERWYAHWHEHRVEPSPMLEEVTWWLRRNRPSSTDPVTIVWGDVGIANSICSPDGRVLAMSDFELAGLGDPMRDLGAGIWRGADRLAGRQHFLDAYEAAGGRTVAHDRIRYYEVFMNWLTAIFAHAAVRPGDHGRGLHPPLLQIWAQRVNLHKAGRLIGI
jgi:aminoglycoside phosphotransferase (APT) family kinase protein